MSINNYQGKRFSFRSLSFQYFITPRRLGLAAMAVPYGFGVGDFIALGTLAWKVYKCTKGAPDSFQKIHVEVLSLRVVLEEAQETIFKRPLDLKRQQRLKVIAGGCQSVLTDLDNLVLKYESLGAQTKRTWNRLKWGNEDLAELRARLGNNVTMLSAFIRYFQTDCIQGYRHS